jgi:hypothetical protein
MIKIMLAVSCVAITCMAQEAKKVTQSVEPYAVKKVNFDRRDNGDVHIITQMVYYNGTDRTILFKDAYFDIKLQAININDKALMPCIGYTCRCYGLDQAADTPKSPNLSISLGKGVTGTKEDPMVVPHGFSYHCIDTLFLKADENGKVDEDKLIDLCNIFSDPDRQLALILNSTLRAGAYRVKGAKDSGDIYDSSIELVDVKLVAKGQRIDGTDVKPIETLKGAEELGAMLFVTASEANGKF